MTLGKRRDRRARHGGWRHGAHRRRPARGRGVDRIANAQNNREREQILADGGRGGAGSAAIVVVGQHQCSPARSRSPAARKAAMAASSNLEPWRPLRHGRPLRLARGRFFSTQDLAAAGTTRPKAGFTARLILHRPSPLSAAVVTAPCRDALGPSGSSCHPELVVDRNREPRLTASASLGHATITRRDRDGGRGLSALQSTRPRPRHAVLGAGRRHREFAQAQSGCSALTAAPNPSPRARLATDNGGRGSAPIIFVWPSDHHAEPR